MIKLTLRDLKPAMRPDEQVVLFDRFNRKIEQSCPLEELPEYLLNCRIDDMYYSPFYKAIAFKLKVGKFEV